MKERRTPQLQTEPSVATLYYGYKTTPSTITTSWLHCKGNSVCHPHKSMACNILRRIQTKNKYINKKSLDIDLWVDFWQYAVKFDSDFLAYQPIAMPDWLSMVIKTV